MMRIFPFGICINGNGREKLLHYLYMLFITKSQIFDLVISLVFVVIVSIRFGFTHCCCYCCPCKTVSSDNFFSAPQNTFKLIMEKQNKRKINNKNLNGKREYETETEASIWIGLSVIKTMLSSNSQIAPGMRDSTNFDLIPVVNIFFCLLLTIKPHICQKWYQTYQSVKKSLRKTFCASIFHRRMFDSHSCKVNQSKMKKKLHPIHTHKTISHQSI